MSAHQQSRSQSRSPAWRAPVGFGPVRGRDVVLQFQGNSRELHAHSFVLMKHLGKTFHNHVSVTEDIDGVSEPLEVTLVGDLPETWCKLLEIMYMYESIDFVAAFKKASCESHHTQIQQWSRYLRSIEISLVKHKAGFDKELKSEFPRLNFLEEIDAFLMKCPKSELVDLVRLIVKYDCETLKEPIVHALGGSEVFDAWPADYTHDLVEFLLHADMVQPVQQWFLRAKCSLASVVEQLLRHKNTMLYTLAWDVALCHIGILKNEETEYLRAFPHDPGGFPQFWDGVARNRALTVDSWRDAVYEASDLRSQCHSYFERPCFDPDWPCEMPYCFETVDEMKSWLKTIADTYKAHVKVKWWGDITEEDRNRSPESSSARLWRRMGSFPDLSGDDNSNRYVELTKDEVSDQAGLSTLAAKEAHAQFKIIGTRAPGVQLPLLSELYRWLPKTLQDAL